MRTRFLNKILPLGVGMMAVAFAFATEGKSSTKDGSSTLYIYDNLECTEVSMECDNVQIYPCTFEGERVHLIKDSQTSCSVALFNSFPTN
ncbi:DUF6520 family protein [Empedobacter stercoris]|uniref:DUF6520 family protein n=1 Tax=Empedobacter stercoris TaxID=1628248 RepID=UPI001CE1998C|nr:DUF6520 family protein [Empedobacter stercoris]MCA4776088.1 hypothetical protein [Empedobacter stercoris]